MLNDINLIPQTEVVEQKKTQVLKSSSIFSVILLIVSIGVSAYYFINLTDVNSKIKQTDADIEMSRGQIRSMSEIEVSARNLDKKISALKTLFNGRSKYSLLLKEMEARKPADVTIQNSDIKVGQISISGTSGSYISVQSYVNNFLNKDFEGGNPELKDMFVDVSLNSVSLDKGSNSVKFLIVVSYQDGKLQGL
ncbi:PilN domain-containing protein [Patescibacteria group bacterium]|nr:PilN domain-containing protein [Patescibacteria group bacterium]